MSSFDHWLTTEPDWSQPGDRFDEGYAEGFSHGYSSATHDHDGGPVLFALMLAGVSGSIVGFLVGWFL